MSYLKRIAGHTAVYGLSSVVPRLLNYLLVPLHTRVFLQEDYGVVTEMYAYLAVLLVLLTYGMETGFFRFSSEDKESNVTYSTAFFSLLFSSTIFILFASLFSQSIVNVIGYPDNKEYVILLASIIGLDAFSTIPFAKLRLLNRAYTFALIKILGVVINVSLNFFFLLVCPAFPFFEAVGIYNPELGINYIFISNLIGTLVSTLVIFFVPGMLPTTFSFKRLKVLLVYSFPLLISGLGGSSNEFFDRIFLKYLTDPDSNPLYQLGVYGANAKLAVLMTLFIQMYRYAVEPFIFSSIDDKESPSRYAVLTKYFLAFALTIFMSVGLFTELFQVLIGKGFREGIAVVPILLMSNLFLGLYINFSIWYKVSNKTWYGILYTFTGAAVTMFLYVLLIPILGYYGAAIAKLICYILMSIICYYGGQRHYPVPYEVKKFVLFILSAVALFIAGYFVNISYYPLSIIYRIALILAFLAIVIFIDKIPVLKLIRTFKR
jgi:O-antigen/teichoic acid export membrane protein